VPSESPSPETTFAGFRDGYLTTIGSVAVEKNTLYTSKIQLAHLAVTLGELYPMASHAHADFQRHVARSSAWERVAAITIRGQGSSLCLGWASPPLGRPTLGFGYFSGVFLDPVLGFPG